jgi:hypothetical protein
MADSILVSPRFWQQTAVRCLRTFAQAAGGVLGASATNVLAATWQQAATAGAYAAAIAFLMSLEKLEELPPGTPEDKAVDEMMKRQGIDSAAPLPATPATPGTVPTTVTNAPNAYVPPTTAPPPPPGSSTPPTYVPASAPATSPVITSGYPTLGDPV